MINFPIFSKQGITIEISTEKSKEKVVVTPERLLNVLNKTSDKPLEGMVGKAVSDFQEFDKKGKDVLRLSVNVKIPLYCIGDEDVITNEISLYSSSSYVTYCVGDYTANEGIEGKYLSLEFTLLLDKNNNKRSRYYHIYDIDLYIDDIEKEHFENPNDYGKLMKILNAETWHKDTVLHDIS